MYPFILIWGETSVNKHSHASVNSKKRHAEAEQSMNHGKVTGMLAWPINVRF
jgi:hypothetical protein